MKALLCVDFINDIIDPAGKLAGKGYAAFAQANRTLASVADLQRQFRSSQRPVLHVRIGFAERYLDWPERSMLFGKAREYGALAIGEWGTGFVAEVTPIAGELVIRKPRVSAFFATELDLVLRKLAVSELVLCGVATDLAVSSTARDAHDRDYAVTVVADSCAAACQVDHESELAVLRKIARVVPLWGDSA